MSALQMLRDLLPGTSRTEQQSGLEALQDILARREADLRLTAHFDGEPYPDMQGEETVVFPYTLRTNDGEYYGEGHKEFIIPDDGFVDQGTNLAEFIKDQTGADEANFEALRAVQGSEAPATLGKFGDVEVL